MEEKEMKKELKLENEVFKERFQFLLSANDNIICQRYFKINGFNIRNLESLEAKETFDECVRMIQNDLVSKSRVYSWYTSNEPIKLTGFGEEADNVEMFKYPEEIVDLYQDDERPQPYEMSFKFSFIIDGKVAYERIWDGSVYQKYVRNSVDLTNSDVMYKDKNPVTLPFNIAIIRRMTVEKIDLVYHIIKKICEVLSAPYDEDSVTKYTYYGDKKMWYTNYNKEFVFGWSKAVKEKTDEYFMKLYPSAKKLEHIDRYM